jgi:WS/DGAT/MGAT family acyltransferase
MDRLSAEDQIMLWPDRRWPQVVGALLILDAATHFDADGRLRIEELRTHVERRLHRVPRFRQVLLMPRPGAGPPAWTDTRTFDISDHVKVASVPAPGGEAELLETVERLRARRLDRTKPLWEMWFLTGLPDRRVALFVKIHHVMADGMAAVAAMGQFLDEVPDPSIEPPSSWTPNPPPTDRQLRLDDRRRRLARRRHGLTVLQHPVPNLRRLWASLPAVRDLYTAGSKHHTSLNRLVGEGRRIRLVRASLDELKRVAHDHDATVNDVLVSAVGGAVASLLAHRGEPVPDTLPIYVPVTLRSNRNDSGATGNVISQIVVPVPTRTTDRVGRLVAVAAETRARKGRDLPSLDLFTRSRLARLALLKMLARRPVNVTTADLPGPPVPVYFAAAPVLEVFPLLPLIATESLGVGALSYAGRFAVTVVADRDAYPDLDVFVTALQAELDLSRQQTEAPAAASADEGTVRIVDR